MRLTICFDDPEVMDRRSWDGRYPRSTCGVMRSSSSGGAPLSENLGRNFFRLPSWRHQEQLPRLSCGSRIRNILPSLPGAAFHDLLLHYPHLVELGEAFPRTNRSCRISPGGYELTLGCEPMDAAVPVSVGNVQVARGGRGPSGLGHVEGAARPQHLPIRALRSPCPRVALCCPARGGVCRPGCTS